MTAVSRSTTAEGMFCHEALFYRSESEFLRGTVPFIEAAVRHADPILVVVGAGKIDLLRGHLGADAAAVQFADMSEVGTNPARIIPAWADFVAEYGDRPLRGVGEPIWPERGAEELVECQGHESLLNVVFQAVPRFTLLCPYDDSALPPELLAEARRSHRFVRHPTERAASADYRGTDAAVDLFTAPLPPAPAHAVAFDFAWPDVASLRSWVAAEAAGAGLGAERTPDAVAAVHELAANSIRYGGGHGVLRLWSGEAGIVCEVTDSGHIDDPLVGRIRPRPDRRGGRGLWMVNQLCELVQIRSTPKGTTVRIHLRCPPVSPATPG